MIRFLFFLLIFQQVQSQNDTIVPTKGTIVFVKKQIITDQQAYDESTALLSLKILENQKAAIIKKRKTQGLSTDSITVNGMISQLKIDAGGNLYKVLNDDFRTYRFYNEFNGNKIYYYHAADKDNATDTVTYTTSKLPADFIPEKQHIGSQLKILSLKEFPNELETIAGYTCFRVELYYLEVFDEDDSQNFKNALIQRKELWVTKKIKSPIHPVIYQKEILEKYYPLKIVEYPDEIKGFKSIYVVEKVEIK